MCQMILAASLFILTTVYLFKITFHLALGNESLFSTKITFKLADKPNKHNTKVLLSL